MSCVYSCLSNCDETKKVNMQVDACCTANMNKAGSNEQNWALFVLNPHILATSLPYKQPGFLPIAITYPK